MSQLKSGLFALTIFLVAGCSVEPDVNEPLLLLTNAEQTKLPTPLVSSAFPALSLDDTYRIQSNYVDWHMKKGRVISGYKAGLTSAASQARFNAEEPVAGVLFTEGGRGAGAVIDSQRFGKLMVEAELGFLAKEAIREPVSSVDELKKLFSHTLPVIELPDLGFADLKQLTTADIVAANAAVKEYIVGEKVSLTNIDPNSVEAAVYNDGKKVISGSASDAMGNQWQALLWLVNHTLSQGYQINEGALFITGALGAMVPGKVGNYKADFGELGTLAFSVQ